MTDKLLPIVPGCDAIITNSVIPTAIGRQVKVLRWGEPGERFKDKILNPECRPGWIVLGDFKPQGWGWYYEERLMRIDGFKETEQEKARELNLL